ERRVIDAGAPGRLVLPAPVGVLPLGKLLDRGRADAELDQVQCHRPLQVPSPQATSKSDAARFFNALRRPDAQLPQLLAVRGRYFSRQVPVYWEKTGVPRMPKWRECTAGLRPVAGSLS